MSKPVILTADSTCDLSPELAQRLRIQTIPLTVMEGDRAFKDGVDIAPDVIYDIYRREGLLPKTAAISPQECLDFFRPMVEAGYEVVHLDISSRLSATYQNACIAASELEGVHPVDSMHLSNSILLLLLEACRARDEGRAAGEIVRRVEAMREKVRTSFVVDTLEFIWKGGRCSGVTALGANLLKIKPCLEMRDGELTVGKKYRGAMAKVYAQYIRDQLTGQDIDTRAGALVHSGGIAPETLAELRRLVLELVPFDQLTVLPAGCTISSHCGPAAMGILYAVR